MAVIGEDEVLIALGANAPSDVGLPEQTMVEAIDVLNQESFRILAVSPFYRTPAFPLGAGPDFVNAAARARTSHEPEALLQFLHRVEAAFGRERKVRWGMRTLDIDLIAYGQAVLPDAVTQAYWRDLPPDVQKTIAPKQLILPHPRMQDRAFVLVPLADIAPKWRHPILGQTVREMVDLQSNEAIGEVKQLSGASHDGLSIS